VKESLAYARGYRAEPFTGNCSPARQQGDFRRFRLLTRAVQLHVGTTTVREELSEILNHPRVAFRGRPPDSQILTIWRSYRPGIPATSGFPKRLHMTIQIYPQECGADGPRRRFNQAWI